MKWFGVVFIRSQYVKFSKILNTLLFLFAHKMLVIRAGSHNALKECAIFKTILEHSFALPPSDTM